MFVLTHNSTDRWMDGWVGGRVYREHHGTQELIINLYTWGYDDTFQE